METYQFILCRNQIEHTLELETQTLLILMVSQAYRPQVYIFVWF